MQNNSQKVQMIFQKNAKDANLLEKNFNRLRVFKTYTECIFVKVFLIKYFVGFIGIIIHGFFAYNINES